MKKMNILTRILPLAAIAVMGALIPSIANAQSPDSGAINMTGSTSDFVEIRSGSTSDILGDVGGSVTGATKGGALNSVNVDFGEVGPSNTSTEANGFVKAIVPLRLRSNVGYVLSMGVEFTETNPAAVQLTDIGFGLSAANRDDTDVQSGTDGTETLGDPSSSSTDAVSGTHRFDFASGKSLAAFEGTTGATILSGPAIMDVVPAGLSTDGLTTNAYFAIRPQYFAKSTFTPVVTFTITAAP